MPQYSVACQRILRGIGDRDKIRTIIRRAALTKVEERIMTMRYVDKLSDLQVIADRIGYSYSATAKSHAAASRKIMQFLI